jgi:hypothetical protein
MSLINKNSINPKTNLDLEFKLYKDQIDSIDYEIQLLKNKKKELERQILDNYKKEIIQNTRNRKPFTNSQSYSSSYSSMSSNINGEKTVFKNYIKKENNKEIQNITQAYKIDKNGEYQDIEIPIAQKSLKNPLHKSLNNFITN